MVAMVDFSLAAPGWEDRRKVQEATGKPVVSDRKMRWMSVNNRSWPIMVLFYYRL